MGFLRNQNASTAAAFLLSPILVALTTWLLLAVQHVAATSHGAYVRPYSICYLIPIAIVTILGGRFAGYFCILLALISLDYYLIAPNHSILAAQNAPDLAEMFFLLLTGALMIWGLDTLRNYGQLRVDAEESAARLRTIMDTAPIGVLVTDLAGTIRYANPESERMLGRSSVNLRIDAVEHGQNGPPVRPRGRPAESILTPILQNIAPVEIREWTHEVGGTTVTIEARATLVRDAVGSPLSGVVVLLDISERRRVEKQIQARANREALVNRIGEALRGSMDPDDIQYTAVAALGDALKADRCYFMTYDYSADYAWAGRDWRRSDLASLAGQYRTSELRLHPNRLYRPGKTLVVDDVQSGFFPDLLVNDFNRFKMRSLIGVPIYEDGQLAATLLVAMADEPRAWTPEEILLTEAVAGQTRSAVAVARLLIQERGRRRMEEVASRIAQTLRYSTDPDIVRSRAFSVIGNALDVDYCFAIGIEEGDAGFTIYDDWRRDQLPSVAGRRSRADLPLHVETLFNGAPTLVVDNADKEPWAGDTARAMAALGLRSMIAVPMFDRQNLLGLLIAGMANSERAWSGEDIRLMENAAAQTRLTLEAARIRLREHTVAEALQDALQPRPPEGIPVFNLDFYYQAALDEASVGGDFYDVFAVDKGVYAIAIGDVSGKGISAAAQIASVRNMLRYAVSHDHDLAAAITKLNQTLAVDSQLTGFATLFVGVFDANAERLTFVSCGHEPALVRHAGDNVIDQLCATGPPLGAFVESVYEQETAPLRDGDTLLLYTDGISEAGPNRSSLLGTDGLIRMFKDGPRGETARQLIERLVARVKSYANGVMRDDVCVVAAVIGKQM